MMVNEAIRTKSDQTNPGLLGDDPGWWVSISGATRSGRRYLNPALPANAEEAEQQMSGGPPDPAALQVQIDALQAQLQQRDADLAAAQQAQQLLTQQLAQAQQQQAPQA
eukprot:Cvel_18081.t1-p1 / transcript=Cvel_18081.t1 / gene=Cvel_18081 / organism=Chromera_velia_CCMP2878 / gene_product=hypothetical protein / transcript_product=hypothetical protein / location=Cvel_scaffold1480:1-3816(-) / protein_length=108 / sequence_SO=supercontig / SO=protein_coding / is_pseudo=false